MNVHIDTDTATQIANKYKIDGDILAILYLDSASSARIQFQIYTDGSMIIKIADAIVKDSLAISIDGIAQLKDFLANIVPYLFTVKNT